MSGLKTREQLLTEWWSAWRQKDYSWDGLAGKTWRGWAVTAEGRLIEAAKAPDGGRLASLQDYWRRDVSGRLRSDEEMGWELAHHEGRAVYHVVHLPLQWADGVPAKDEWGVPEKRRLIELLATHINPQQENDRTMRGAPAQLQGAVILDFPPFPAADLRFCCSDAFFARIVLMAAKTTLDGADYRGALFASYSDFDGVRFIGTAKFSDAIFLSFTSFRAEFSSDAEFTGATFVREASFSKASFLGAADFSRASFHATTWFRETKFESNSDFAGVTSADFLDFEKAQFGGKLSFGSATLNGSVDFDEAKFNEAEFTNVKFNGFARFVKAKFTGEAQFTWSTFAKITLFEPTTFASEVSFERVTFSDVVSFCKAIFAGGVNFGFAHFARRTRFEDVRFESDAKPGRMEFMNAQFMELADFGGASFPSRCEQFSGAFTGTRFGGVAYFQSAGSHWIAALDGAYLERSLILDDLGEADADREFHKLILPSTRKTGEADVAHMVERVTKERAERAAETGLPTPPITNRDRKEWLREAPQNRLRELIGGCRTVKVAMGRQRDEALEQRYYRFQLIARRQQAATPVAEKLYSWLYGAFADYGVGLWQPFVALISVVLVFAGVYWGWGEALRGWPDAGWRLSLDRPVDQDAWDAVLFSTNNTFRPLSVWSTEFSQNTGSEWIEGLLSAFDKPGEGGQRVAIRLVATVQSVLSLILFFLMALAVRRRFQIS